MKTLVVGGTGMIGGHAALFLKKHGYDVTITGRKPPGADTPMTGLPFQRGDFVAGDFGRDVLSGFDSIVFAAGNDFRHLDPNGDAVKQLERANCEAVPRFFRDARDAGVRRAIYIGSFYSQAVPGLAKTNDYVRSRVAADEGARAANTDRFAVISLNAPMIVGQMPGLGIKTLAGEPRYALGLLPDMPVFAPEGGTHFMSLRSLSEAILGALRNGTPGKAYLVGDQNLSFKDYLDMYFRAAGRDIRLEVRNAEHPLIPASWIYTGLGSTVAYDIPPDEAKQLGYTRNDVARAVKEIVDMYKAQNGMS